MLMSLKTLNGEVPHQVYFARCFGPSMRITVALCFTLGMLIAPIVHAQAPARSSPSGKHYLLDSRFPPGFVAHAQIAGQRTGVGSFTAISIIGPVGTRVGLARDGQLLPPIDTPVVTGMLVGAVYRFHVTQIPGYPGEELFPTLEVIDRIYPEQGRDHRFPIPILLTEEDLQVALGGGLVTRVIYLEDSEVAEPVARQPGQQSTFEAGPQDNALQVADQMGRPLAILRIGSRIPPTDPMAFSEFLYGCPPWIALPTAPNVETLRQQGHLPGYVPTENTNPLYSQEIIEQYPRIR
jgi:hypothetical protein